MSSFKQLTEVVAPLLCLFVSTGTLNAAEMDQPIPDGIYTIQQKATGRFVDAYESSHDYMIVTRNRQGDGSQEWILKHVGSNTYTIQQKKNGRFIDAYTTKKHNLVTRTKQSAQGSQDASQLWVFDPVDDNAFTIQHKVNGRFVDAHQKTHDHALVTQTPQNDDTQKWILTSVKDYSLQSDNPCAVQQMATSQAESEPLTFKSDEYLSVVKRFAPILMFDRAYKGLPMSANEYFANVIEPYPKFDPEKCTVTWEAPWDGPALDTQNRIQCLSGRDECTNGMQNMDFQKLSEIPTYYQVISDDYALGEGRLRIAYWWFYGFQSACNLGTFGVKAGKDGAHHGDWERIYVTTSPDRQQIEAVTFGQHNGWYTRHQGDYKAEGVRPIVFVGKISHGNYHDRCSASEGGCSDFPSPVQCKYFGDFRNPTVETRWDTSENLVNMMGKTESWMEADAIGSRVRIDDKIYTIESWQWGPHISWCDYMVLNKCTKWKHQYAISGHPTTEKYLERLAWSAPDCKSDGCDRSQGWPFDY